MIGQVTRHGRTMRDARNLRAHLLKEAYAQVEIMNSLALDLDEVIYDMLIARDGSRADSAFLHIVISPSSELTSADLRRAAEIVAQHFGASEHQAALVIHEKDRLGGAGTRHGHIVLGRVGPDGQVIPAGFEKIKLETAMRILEVELGERITLGRHHQSAVKWLRENNRLDVVAAMEAAHGSNPDKPTSAASPDKRHKIERQGVNLAASQQAVRDAWACSDDGRPFTQALAESGLSVAPGAKTGVFIVCQGDIEIGALDRLLKQKRRDVAARMKGFNHDPEPQGPAALGDGRTRKSDLPRNEEVTPVVDALGDTRSIRTRADRADPGASRNLDPRPEAAASLDRGSSQQGRLFDPVRAVAVLTHIRVSSDVLAAAQDIRMRTASRENSSFELNQSMTMLEISSGWERLQHLKDRLVAAIRMTAERVRAFRAPPKPQHSVIDQQVADVFRKAVHCSAENIQRLEQLDPELDAFRLHHGGEAFRGFTYDEILDRLDTWRDQARELVLDDEDDDYRQTSGFRP